MKYIHVITQVILFIIFNQVHAQNKCGTTQYNKHLQHKNKSLRNEDLNFSPSLKNKSINARSETFTIPVVFHVIHTNGPENISREQINDQIRIINNDFNLQNTNRNNLRNIFNGLAANCQIKFELAKIDPNGNCTDGINRIYSSLGNKMDLETEEVKSVINWDYTKYLNVWVVSSIVDGANGGEVLGYATLPWATDSRVDGVVIKSSFVGSIGTAAEDVYSRLDSGRTLTHEFGHYLGLYHPFDNGGCDGNGDGCDDTPPVANDFANWKCPTDGNSCSNDSPDLPDMWENFMEYSVGGCQTLFTNDQKYRMHNVLNKYYFRENLITKSNLISTGLISTNIAPKAEFNSNSTTVCVNEPVGFYSLACYGKPTSWSWYLPGSSQENSTMENPVVTYKSNGIFKVTLKVKNNFGEDSITKNSYINVLPSESNLQPNFFEYFEKGDPTTFNYYNKFNHSSPEKSRFQLTSQAFYEGKYSIVAPISKNTPQGSNFSITLPAIDFTRNSSGLKFTFMTAYAQPNAEITEILRIYVSTDCGKSFKQIKEWSGNNLAYLGQTYTQNFKPMSNNQWRILGLSLTTSLGLNSSKNAIFRIDVLSSGGNPVYIDNINISNFNASIVDLNPTKQDIILYPNPLKDFNELMMYLDNDLFAQIEMYDINGSLVCSSSPKLYFKGDNNIDLNSNIHISDGVFIIRINTSNQSFYKTVIFRN